MQRQYRDKPVRKFDVNQTVYSALNESFSEFSKMSAIGYMGMEFTYVKLQKKLQLYANMFKNLGVKEGDTISVCTSNTPEVPLILAAASALGAATKWIDLRSTDVQLIEKINAKGSRLFVGFDFLMPRMERVLRETDLENILYISPADYINPFKVLLNSKEDFKKLLEEGKQAPNIVIPKDDRIMNLKKASKVYGNYDEVHPVSFDKDRPTLYIQSSGTTGPAKSIVHTDYSINCEVRKWTYADLILGPGYRMFVTAPPWVAYGLINAYLLALMTGMKAVIYPKIYDAMVYDNLDKFDTCFAVPLHFRHMVNEVWPKLSTTEKISLLIRLRNKCYLAGGDKVTASEIREFKEKLGIDVLNAWGDNEALGGLAANTMHANKPGSVGKPLYGDKIVAVDENGKELPPNVSGEIVAVTDSMFQKYDGDEEETKRIQGTFNGEPCIHTEDSGYIDEDGFIFLNGRLGRSITIGGFKVYPGTIEEQVLKHPAVKDCVAIGVKDKEMASVPMVFFTMDTTKSWNVDEVISQIDTICTENLESYKCPSYIICIDEIPYNQSQKQDYKKLEILGNELVAKKGNVPKVLTLQ